MRQWKIRLEKQGHKILFFCIKMLTYYQIHYFFGIIFSGKFNLHNGKMVIRFYSGVQKMLPKFPRLCV